jgi:hypothetical protein
MSDVHEDIPRVAADYLLRGYYDARIRLLYEALGNAFSIQSFGDDDFTALCEREDVALHTQDAFQWVAVDSIVIITFYPPELRIEDDGRSLMAYMDCGYTSKFLPREDLEDGSDD